MLSSSLPVFCWAILFSTAFNISAVRLLSASNLASMLSLLWLCTVNIRFILVVISSVFESVFRSMQDHALSHRAGGFAAWWPSAALCMSSFVMEASCILAATCSKGSPRSPVAVACAAVAAFELARLADALAYDASAAGGLEAVVLSAFMSPPVLGVAPLLLCASPGLFL